MSTGSGLVWPPWSSSTSCSTSRHGCAMLTSTVSGCCWFYGCADQHVKRTCELLRWLLCLGYKSPSNSSAEASQAALTPGVPFRRPLSDCIPSSRCSGPHSAPAALESPSVTLRPTEEEEEAKAKNAKGVEEGAVQSKQQNGQDGAASQKVSISRE